MTTAGVSVQMSKPTAIALATVFIGGLGVNLYSQLGTRSDVGATKDSIADVAKELRKENSDIYMRKDVAQAEIALVSARIVAMEASLGARLELLQRAIEERRR